MTTFPSTWVGNPEGFQIVVDAAGNQFDGTRISREVAWKAKTSRTEDGYVVEIEIPLDLIDTEDGPELRPAAKGSELRFNIQIEDNDEDINRMTFQGLLWSEDRLWSASHGGEDFWPATLRLVPPVEPRK
jgi:hypothetical protein